MRFSSAPFILVLAFSTTTLAISLIDALNANGATKFAQQIQSDPAILALYNSSSVQTVYAPQDNSTGANSLAARATTDPAQMQYQCSQQLNTLETLQFFPGSDTSSNLPSPQLGAQKQSAVSQAHVNTTAPASKMRRWYPTTPVTIASGLGNKVNLLRGDIAYDGGIIHIIDGYFTIPECLSDTISATGLSSLQSSLAKANLSSTLNASNSITIFTPNNAAFAAANISSSALPSVLGGHVIPNFVGYLPLLRNGSSFTTLSGDVITITIKNGTFFVNDAQIVSPNTITENGVAHVINKVLTPTPVAFTGAGWSLKEANILAAAFAAAALTVLVI